MKKSNIAKQTRLPYSHGKVSLKLTETRPKPMIVGTEWLVEAIDCDAEKLRQIAVLKTVFAQLSRDLQLKTVGDVQWHQFPMPGNGVTGFAMLTESHFACHTYPEHQIATFNLYCCRTRPEWNWTENLSKLLGAKRVQIKKIERGKTSSRPVLKNQKSVEILISTTEKESVNASGARDNREEDKDLVLPLTTENCNALTVGVYRDNNFSSQHFDNSNSEGGEK